MHVAIVHDARLPVPAYGGTERVVWWLAKGLSELGCRVSLVCRPGSRCEFAEVVPFSFDSSSEKAVPTADIVHHFVTPASPPERPYVVTIGGNGKVGETFLPNTVFISRNHAARHRGECFVYHGLDPDEYRYGETKQDFLVFLAKASWRVKNVAGAIRCARRAGRELHVIGGRRLWPNRLHGIHWKGMLGGERKAELLARASALLFPVLWNEPFGIALIEALVSGTPVIGSRLGSLPEIVTSDVGFLCGSEDEMVDAVRRVASIPPGRCRDAALARFHYRRMAADYLALYDKVGRGEPLNREVPIATEVPERRLPLGGLSAAAAP